MLSGGHKYTVNLPLQSMPHHDCNKHGHVEDDVLRHVAVCTMHASIVLLMSTSPIFQTYFFPRRPWTKPWSANVHGGMRCATCPQHSYICQEVTARTICQSPGAARTCAKFSDTVCMLVVVPEKIWPFLLTTACEEQLCRQHRSKSIKVTAEATSCFTAISSFL